MQIEYDQFKHEQTLSQRGLDFSDAEEVFSGKHYTAEDVRHEYGEPRFITAGLLKGRMVLVVWTPRGEVRRIISMRKANERETTLYANRLG